LVDISHTKFKPGFLLEQTLGHVTHSVNLKRFLSENEAVEPVWMDVPFKSSGLRSKLPPVSKNWSLRGSLAARDLLSSAVSSGLQALFVHTLTVSLFATRYYEQIPTVISTDATPINFDSLSVPYGHRRYPAPVESIKLALTKRVLTRARHCVAWSEWAKASLVTDYGVAPSQVEVIMPGADLELFRCTQSRTAQGKVRILFVGGDFQRKGGDLLLQVFRERLRGRAELHLVTGADIEPEEDVYLYKGLVANSPPLLNLYRTADIFVLPTRADCLAMVLAEAMAASLPVITTSIAGLLEVVEDGKTGYAVPPDDAESLGNAIETLVENPGMRRMMGEAGRQFAEENLDARTSVGRVVDLLQSLT
jgi:glycosyltransferase involved in cell wall biosynthesis